MRKVVIVQEYVPMYRTSFFRLLHDLGRERGIDIRVAYGEAGKRQQARRDSGSLSFGLPIRQREFLFAGRRLVTRQIRQAAQGADLVVLEQARRNVDAYVLLAPRIFRRYKMALWGHGKDYTHLSAPLDRGVQRLLTSRADWFFAYTQGGVDAVVADGFPARRTTVVQNSIDSAGLANAVQSVTAEQVDSFSAQYDLRGYTALFLGALDESKRLPFLIKAGELAFAKDPRFRLIVAGDGLLRSDIEMLATQHSWMSYLGPVAGEGKAVALAACQVLAMPGRVGLIAVDSFAAGIPIVTTDWLWHAPEFDYLESGRNAVVSADKVSAYSSALLETLSDSEVVARLSRVCREDSASFSVEQMAKNFLAGICEALEVQIP